MPAAMVHRRAGPAQRRRAGPWRVVPSRQVMRPAQATGPGTTPATGSHRATRRRGPARHRRLRRHRPNHRRVRDAVAHPADRLVIGSRLAWRRGRRSLVPFEEAGMLQREDRLCRHQRQQRDVRFPEDVRRLIAFQIEQPGQRAAAPQGQTQHRPCTSGCGRTGRRRRAVPRWRPQSAAAGRCSPCS